MNRKLNYEQAAAKIGVPVGTIYAWVWRRQIPHIRLGRRLVRFSEEVLDRWLKEREVTPRNETRRTK